MLASSRNAALGPVENIARSICILRGQKILLDAELAILYGVTTRRLNEQVRRNRKRFPADFLFELTLEEFANLKSHSATSSWGGRRKLPWAFTEHGAIMAATVLNSARATEMAVYIVRAFVKLRTLLASNRDLADKLTALERSLVALDLKTQSQFKEVYEAIRALMSDPPPKQRPIGFTADFKQET
ncbi:MAG: ORF6N domain-containing protein [Gammaproteobacteria bacterium]|nr:ORF6N domain-containing protein [Gammaproteobacteria bacterium]